MVPTGSNALWPWYSAVGGAALVCDAVIGVHATIAGGTAQRLLPLHRTASSVPRGGLGLLHRLSICCSHKPLIVPLFGFANAGGVSPEASIWSRSCRVPAGTRAWARFVGKRRDIRSCPSSCEAGLAAAKECKLDSSLRRRGFVRHRILR
jgi:Na+/H+ antiporter NhaA